MSVISSVLHCLPYTSMFTKGINLIQKYAMCNKRELQKLLRILWPQLWTSVISAEWIEDIPFLDHYTS